MVDPDDDVASPKFVVDSAAAHIRAGRYQQAFEDLLAGLEEAPEDQEIAVQLGKLALRIGMPDDARVFLSAVKDGPAGRRRLEALAQELSLDGRPQHADLVASLLASDGLATLDDVSGPGGEQSARTRQRELYERYRTETAVRVAAGREGALRLTPNVLWLAVSLNCNLKCVGCYLDGKYRKHYASVEDVRQLIECEGPVNEISFTRGEAFLNPHFAEILELCRERHPKARLTVISNGTVPVKGRYRKALSMIDRLGLSVDGATKGTYESIRIGAVFERFVEHARDIVALRAETGYPKSIGFAFTATTTNLHELIDLIRLAKDVGVDDVWAQPMVAYEPGIRERVADILLDNMADGTRTRLIDEAQDEARRIGMPFHHWVGLYPGGDTSEPAHDVDSDLEIRMCQVPWTQPAQVQERADGSYAVHPCCKIETTTKASVLMDKYGLRLESLRPMDEIYNSASFWQFREDLMEGRTTDVCGRCRDAAGFQWVPAD